MTLNKEMPALIIGMMSTLVGIGIARFAYTPLLPALIEAQWFSASQAAYLGAANLLGYFIGALSAHTLSERWSPRVVIGVCFIAVALSFLFCAWPGSFPWFFLWRLVSGIAGAILVVVGPSLALSATPVERRTRVGTLAFMGIGLGALLSASVVPTLLELSLMVTWLTLGLLCFAAGVLSNQGFAHLAALPSKASAQATGQSRLGGVGMVVVLVIGAYAFTAAGYVPHTVFWVDYLARENALGYTAASLQWGFFGLGAVCGPLIVGSLAGRLGWHRALAIAFLTKAAAISLPIVSLSFFSQTVSSLAVGAMVPGVVALTSGRLAELVGPIAHKKIWGRATAVFAAGQAISGYGMSALYDAWGTYAPLFIIGGCLLAAGLMLILVSRGVEARQLPG